MIKYCHGYRSSVAVAEAIHTQLSVFKERSVSVLCGRPQTANLKSIEKGRSSRLAPALPASNLRGRAQPLPLEGGVARAAWLVDTQGWCLGLVLKVILSGTAPCWQLCNPKGALVMTNKAVKDTHRSKKIHSLKE